MNNLIMGLSCLGVLSAVSCDNNEQIEKITIPSLQKVNFSATNAADNQASAFPFKAGEKVTLIVKKGKSNDVSGFAKYYTDDDRITGTEFIENGYIITLNADGSTENGFYLLSSNAETGTDYTITKFDFMRKNESTVYYELKEPLGFTLKKGTPHKANVKIVERKKGSVKGYPSKGTKVSFGISKATLSQYYFTLNLKKSDDEYFNSTDDKDVTINLDVKDGTKDVYKITNLFGVSGLTAESQKFTITLPREKSHYETLSISGNAMNNGAANSHNFKKNRHCSIWKCCSYG